MGVEQKMGSKVHTYMFLDGFHYFNLIIYCSDLINFNPTLRYLLSVEIT